MRRQVRRLEPIPTKRITKNSRRAAITVVESESESESESHVETSDESIDNPDLHFEAPALPLEAHPGVQQGLAQVFMGNNMLPQFENQQLKPEDIEKDIEERISKIPKRSIDPEIPAVLAEHFTCSICTDIFRKPMTLICQHTFCYDCLLQLEKPDRGSIHMMIVPKQYRCPTCRSRYIFPDSSKHNIVIENFIQSQLDVSQIEERKFTIEKYEVFDRIQDEIRKEIMDTVLGDLSNDQELNLNNLDNRGGRGNQRAGRFFPEPRIIQEDEPTKLLLEQMIKRKKLDKKISKLAVKQQDKFLNTIVNVAESFADTIGSAMAQQIAMQQSPRKINLPQEKKLGFCTSILYIGLFAGVVMAMYWSHSANQFIGRIP